MTARKIALARAAARRRESRALARIREALKWPDSEKKRAVIGAALKRHAAAFQEGRRLEARS